ncbi:MAG: succinyl-diaminopimelate desuccinylase [Acetobacteraceae bacterium]|nr:succinyl-diaminopimelate desuccinylase [Acetobacteraceae bacterium]
MAVDPVLLTQALIRCPSVTPEDAGAIAVLEGVLAPLGFACTRLRFGEVENLFARIGEGRPHFCFAGHTDVVPPGEGWSSDPFAAEIRDGVLYGRGAADMKSGVAAFVAAAAARLAAGPLTGSISLLITGDEEGPARDGTVRVLDWMAGSGQLPDFCLVGEPTSVEALGDTIKIGRRGSLSAVITVRGIQGHVAYPDRADNPLHRLAGVLAELIAEPLDQGSHWFQPSSLQLTSVDVGNPATNVIPAAATARLNIRFNDSHSAASLEAWLRAVLARHAPDHTLECDCSGEAFLTRPGGDVERLVAAVRRATNRTPKLDTGGGTSDARFVARHRPVAEFGLVGTTMHKTDECVSLAQITGLADAYREVLGAFGV